MGAIYNLANIYIYIYIFDNIILSYVNMYTYIKIYPYILEFGL